MSRWGLKGVEELGGNLRAGFILEQGFLADDGTEKFAGRAFGRESIMYLDGDFGRITLGYMGTLGYAQSTAIIRGTVFGNTYGTLGWSAGNINFARGNNAIAYKTPSFGGVTIHAMYSNSGTNSDDTKKWSLNNHYYGIGALYSSKQASGSIIFEASDNKAATAENLRKPQYHITLGGWYDLGAIRPMGVYQYQWGKNYWKQHATQVGFHAKALGATIKVGAKYIYRKVDGEGKLINGKDSASLWTLGASYEYPLSKRTTLYGAGGYTKAYKGWKDTEDILYGGYQLAVGMIHDF